MAIERQTMEQVINKSELWVGLRSFRIRFHWCFWAPLEAIGGKVYFGNYGEYDTDDFNRRWAAEVVEDE